VSRRSVPTLAGLLATVLATVPVGRLSAATAPESLEPVSRPAVALSFDTPSAGISADRLTPGQDGKALAIQDRGVLVEAPADFSWEQGSVEMAIRPDFDCRDDTYHMFFDVRGPGGSAVYLIKSGTGGANGLFMCVIDPNGQWTSAMASAGAGYSWRKGEWHRIGGSWHGGRGLIKLFFDGKEIAERRIAPFRVGVSRQRFGVGASVGQGQAATGLVDDFRLHTEMITQTPVAGAASVLDDYHAWRAIDGDLADGVQWEGNGCPNWLESSCRGPSRSLASSCTPATGDMPAIRAPNARPKRIACKDGSTADGTTSPKTSIPPPIRAAPKSTSSPTSFRLAECASSAFSSRS